MSHSIDVRVVLDEVPHNCNMSLGSGNNKGRPPTIGASINGRTGTK